MSETEAKFLRYKKPDGSEVTEEISPVTDVEDRKRVLGNHGCTDFKLLDADKKPL